MRSGGNEVYRRFLTAGMRVLARFNTAFQVSLCPKTRRGIGVLSECIKSHTLAETFVRTQPAMLWNRCFRVTLL